MLFNSFRQSISVWFR